MDIVLNENFMRGAFVALIVYGVILFVVGSWSKDQHFSFMGNFNLAIALFFSLGFLVMLFGGMVGSHM